MPTIATIAKGITEALVLSAVFIPFVKWIVTKILDQHKEVMTNVLSEMRADRDAHRDEVNAVLTKYDTLHDDHIKFQDSLDDMEKARHTNGVES